MFTKRAIRQQFWAVLISVGICLCVNSRGHAEQEPTPPAAQQAVQKLAGAMIRGRRVAPRLDRNT